MKTRVIVIILSALILAGCGRAPKLSIPEEFAPYVSRFEADASQYGSTVKVTDLVMQFGPMRSPTELGVCEISSGAPPTITIRQDTWQNFSDGDRETLIFHELGHCVLNRPHRSDLDAQGLPVSIMNPYGVPGYWYSQHQKGYLAELYNGAQK